MLSEPLNKTVLFIHLLVLFIIIVVVVVCFFMVIILEQIIVTKSQIKCSPLLILIYSKIVKQTNASVKKD